MAVICVSESIVKLVARMVPNLTAVAPENTDPVMVTAVPTGPDVGVNDVIDGGTRKFMPTLFAVPPGVVTKMVALSNPAGTRAVICVSESTVKLEAGTVPKLTSVAPVKPVPVIVTAVPTGPDAGLNDVIVGTGGGGGGGAASRTG